MARPGGNPFQMASAGRHYGSLTLEKQGQEESKQEGWLQPSRFTRGLKCLASPQITALLSPLH